MSKPSGNQTVTQTVDADQQQRNRDIWQRGQQVSNQPYQGFGGDQIAGPNWYSTQALQGMHSLPTLFGNYANQGAVRALESDQMARQFMGGPAGMQDYTNAGSTGARALGGDQGAIDKMMNPYQQGVLDRVEGDFGRLNDQAQMAINQRQTLGGAFGGSRHGVASGVASGEIARGLGDTMAGLRQTGFNDAMGRAGMAANLGLGAGGLGAQYGQLALGARGQGMDALGYQSDLGKTIGNVFGQQFGMGDHMRGIDQAGLDRRVNDFREQRDWDVRNFGILQSAGQGMPYGTKTSQPLYSNPAAGALGGAATGAQIGTMIAPGIGTGIGAGIGALGGWLL